MKRFILKIILMSIYASGYCYSYADELHNKVIRPKFYVTALRGLSINKASIDTLPRDGTTTSSISTSNTPQFSLELGHYFNDYIRIGTSTHFLPSSKKIITASGVTQDYLSTNTESYAALLNMYLHPIKHLNRLSPYLTGGIGAAFNKIDTTYYVAEGITNTNSFLFANANFNFAWQLGAGINYKINNGIFLDVSYKYLNHGKVHTKHASIIDPGTTSTALETEYDAPKLALKDLVSHQISVGLQIDI